MSNDKVYVRVPKGRRKLDKFIRRLGYQPQFYFSFHFDGNFVLVTAGEMEQVKGYCTRARVDFSKLMRCWQ